MKKICLLFVILKCFCFPFIIKAQNVKLDSLENLLLKHKELDTIRVKLLHKTAYIAYRINIDKVLVYAQEAVDISRNIDYKKGEAESLRLLGLYHDSKSDYSVAIKYFRESLTLYRELGDQRKVSYLYNSIRLVNMYKGHFRKAIFPKS